MRLLFLPRLLRKDGMVTSRALVCGSNYEIIGVGMVQGPSLDTVSVLLVWESVGNERQAGRNCGAMGAVRTRNTARVIITDRVGRSERERVLAIAMLLCGKRVKAEYAV
jgi:hypothetical protein